MSISYYTSSISLISKSSSALLQKKIHSYGIYGKIAIAYARMARYSKKREYFDSIISVHDRARKLKIEFSNLKGIFIELKPLLLGKNEDLKKASNEVINHTLKNQTQNDATLRELAYDFYSSSIYPTAYSLFYQIRNKNETDYIQLGLASSYPLNSFKACVENLTNACECRLRLMMVYRFDMNNREFNRLLKSSLDEVECGDKIVNLLLIWLPGYYDFKDFKKYYDPIIHKSYDYLLKKSNSDVTISKFARMLDSLNRDYAQMSKVLGERSVQVSKNCSPCWNNLAQVYFNQELLGDAKYANEMALKIDKTNIEATKRRQVIDSLTANAPSQVKIDIIH